LEGRKDRKSFQTIFFRSWSHISCVPCVHHNIVNMIGVGSHKCK
uniref:Ovule protein n=1 Tax=Parascaris univalens TaxID=6257 RepID=A0A915CFF2_PARUN